jgi:ArsR family transcriptional regulator, cadmium/lead-responsive transcriptional repressor
LPVLVHPRLIQSKLYYLPVRVTSSSTDALARFGHALSDPTRTRVLLALREGPGYPAELADLAEVTRQAMSNHLACLRGCGLVVAEPEGRRTRYELADPRIGPALGDLVDMVLVVDPDCCGGETTAVALAASVRVSPT